MVDTFTANAGYVIQEAGTNDNTWGTNLNTNWNLSDDFLGKVTEITATGGTVVLTDGQEKVSAIKVAGTLVANLILQFSGRGGKWKIRNDTTADFTVTVRATATGTVLATIPRGVWRSIVVDTTSTPADVYLENEALTSPEVDIPAATTTDILGASSEQVKVSGSGVTITSFGTGANQIKFVRFDDVNTIQHNATTLFLPNNGVDIVTAAGDSFIVLSDSSSNARVMAYQRANGRPLQSGFETGDVAWAPTSSATRPGWVVPNGQTIGSATSGATQRANADTEFLFKWLWNNLADSEASVPGGRGVDAQTDWDNNRQITLPSMNARAIIGLDTLATIDAGRLSAALAGTDGNTPGEGGGSEGHQLTITEMPPHDHPTQAGGNFITNTGGGAYQGGTDGGSFPNTGQTGGGGQHPNMPPFMTGTWYMKL